MVGCSQLGMGNCTQLPIEGQQSSAPRFFLQEMWRDVAGKELRARLKPGLAWLEILS